MVYSGTQSFIILKIKEELMKPSMNCPKCSESIDNDLEACPKCNHVFTQEEREKAIKKANKMTAILFIIVAMGILFWFFSGDEEKKQSAPELTGTILPIEVIKTDIYEKGTTGRIQLEITIMPTAGQTDATQNDFSVTVIDTAIKAQKETKADMVAITMIAQKASNPYGEPQLAFGVYIPDGKGYNGEQEIGPWDNLQVAKRGFTQEERIYLKNWADMRGNFMDSNGDVIDEALDVAISKKMGIEAGSLEPHMNIPWNVEEK